MSSDDVFRAHSGDSSEPVTSRYRCPGERVGSCLEGQAGPTHAGRVDQDTVDESELPPTVEQGSRNLRPQTQVHPGHRRCSRQAHALRR